MPSPPRWMPVCAIPLCNTPVSARPIVTDGCALGGALASICFTSAGAPRAPDLMSEHHANSFMRVGPLGDAAFNVDVPAARERIKVV